MTGHRQVPLVDYLRLAEQDDPELIGHWCEDCRAVYTDHRVACARCGGRRFADRPLARTGRVRSATTIHRGPPGVAVPYTSIVVDIDGGGVVKANLVDDVPDRLEDVLGDRVRLVAVSAGVDAEGTEAIGFGFVSEVEE